MLVSVCACGFAIGRKGVRLDGILFSISTHSTSGSEYIMCGAGNHCEVVNIITYALRAKYVGFSKSVINYRFPDGVHSCVNACETNRYAIMFYSMCKGVN